MDSGREAFPNDIEELKAALVAARDARIVEAARAAYAEAELAVARAKASDDQALIAHQQLRIEKLTATIETDEPGANDAATISRFSASGHERLRGRPVAVMPITDFVDTSPPHNANDHIRLGEMERFRKAVLGEGIRFICQHRVPHSTSC